MNDREQFEKNAEEWLGEAGSPLSPGVQHLWDCAEKYLRRYEHERTVAQMLSMQLLHERQRRTRQVTSLTVLIFTLLWTILTLAICLGIAVLGPRR